jgi:peptidylprolyl isomerase
MKLLYSLAFLLIIIIGCNSESQVITTDTGLMFKEDTLGTGKEVKVGDLVQFHFRGWIVQDSIDLFTNWVNDSLKMFHSIGSSYEMNHPVKIIVGDENFVKGTDAGLVGMKVGGTRTIIIPSTLAYGEKGFGPIPPNTDIKLTVQLLSAKEITEVKQWDVDSSKFNSTQSGLKYAILEEGTGVTADSGDIVTVHYSGYLLDGTKFDSSVEKDEPLKFILKLQPLIPGWEEGMMYLNKGAKAKFIIPPYLGYGPLAQGKIPANSVLVFDVEVVDIER